jgi:hypothetical protein
MAGRLRSGEVAPVLDDLRRRDSSSAGCRRIRPARWRAGVESTAGAVAVGRGAWCCPAAFADCRCLSPDPGSVSRRRSSNWACRFPAPSSRTGFTTGHAQVVADYPAPREGALRLLLGPAIKLLPETLDNRVLALRQCPVLAAFRSAPEPGLRPSTGITRLRRYHEPLRLPQRPKTDRFRSPRLVVATHRRHGSPTLPQRPCAHADSTTPAGKDRFSGRLLLCPPTAFPFWQEGRLQRETIEAYSEFTRFGLRTCTLVSPGISPEASAGRLPASTAPVATERTDNSSDGTFTRWSSRPRRSHCERQSAHVSSPFVSHCQALIRARSPRRVQSNHQSPGAS